MAYLVYRGSSRWCFARMDVDNDSSSRHTRRHSHLQGYFPDGWKWLIEEGR